ncbi:SpoIIE family protein phosphatase [Nostoc sp. CENA67]|uniref:SpoIIE family protein phosphatase n=1 Tax=Amazonocrinis nigriterrae CENA67 TaxID=2794033 RepID=A0A8J7LBC1_9NOST|nr:SpoIIE family protein phosphatase [Amazonocrinis nigriterrae]MBH8563526.1 SpoIIE family protein phosphatase [Amazonocrinis nigriterrae CENA67]
MSTKISDHLDCAFFGRPCFGERFSGDTVIIDKREELFFVAIVDVLGHGYDAYIVARQIEDFLKENWSNDVLATLHQLHAEIRETRGAAAGLSVLNLETSELSYTGVGNTVFRVFGSRSFRLCSTEGIIGSHLRTPIKQKVELTKSDIIVLYTDGIKEHFEINDYPQILYESSNTISRNLVRRFDKLYDDATCVVLRYKK